MHLVPKSKSSEKQPDYLKNSSPQKFNLKDST